MMQEDEGRTITIEPTYRMGPEKDEKFEKLLAVLYKD